MLSIAMITVHIYSENAYNEVIPQYLLVNDRLTNVDAIYVFQRKIITSHILNGSTFNFI